MSNRPRNLDAATYSLSEVLLGIPGMYVSCGDNAIVVTVNEDASEDDRNNLKKLARLGWERWKVRIEGVI
jgi:hypothetical protein